LTCEAGRTLRGRARRKPLPPFGRAPGNGGLHLAPDARSTGSPGTVDNHHTDQIGRAPATKDLDPSELDDLLAEVEPHLDDASTRTWDANVNGILVRLVTNSAHQMDFWTDNWWPGPNDDSVLPHGFIYSVTGVPDHEPHAYYCPDRQTAVFVNTEYYGQCKSWALGIAAQALERDFNTHSIHGACAEVDGQGIVLVAPTGTGKSTQVNKLFQHPEGRIIGDDWIYIEHPEDPDSDAPLTVTQPERSLYVRTENAEEEEWLRDIFSQTKLENVPEDPSECHHDEDEPCQITDHGKDYCLWGFGNSRALLPREAMLGPDKVADQAPMNLVVLLRRVEGEPAEVWLDPDEAVETLREGRYQIRPGAGPKEDWGTYDSEPWYNPYLLKPDHDAQAEFFRREVENSACVLLNTAPEGETIQRTYKRILDALDKA
jgi:hypothetical protein